MNNFSAHADAPPEEGAARQKVIVAVAQELADLSQKHIALQGVIMPLLKSQALSENHIIEAQSADIVAQHLTELSKFLSKYIQLSEAGDSNSISTALDNVALSGLADRIADVCLGLKTQQQAADPVEFF